MHSSKRRAREIAVSAGYISRDTICSSCLSHLSRRSRLYATAAAATAETPTAAESRSNQGHAVVPDQGPAKAYRLLIAPVISRPPLLTREPHPFEKAYHLYQKRLNERLALPLTRYFYYKKGSPGDLEWKRKLKARLTPARDIGVYNAYGKDNWNDEVLVGSQIAERENIVEALIRDAEGKDIVDAQPVGDDVADNGDILGDADEGEGIRKQLEVQIDRPVSRITEADRTNDTKSLSRKLDRSLYLLVKDSRGGWKFPGDRRYGKETLYQAAERIIVQSVGINMNTWVVGNHPVGHYEQTYQKPRLAKVLRHGQDDATASEYEQEEYGEKVFFMKTRIMAGQADLSKNVYGDTDFEWLAKEEIESRVTPLYWRWIRNMLTER